MMEKMWLVVCWLGFAVFEIVECNKLFFPMGSLHLHLPKPSKNPFYPIATLPALPFNPNLLSNLSPLTYTFTSSSHLLQTHNSTSSLYFTETFFSGNSPPGDLDDLSGWLEVQDDLGGYNRTQVSVEVLPEKVKCEKMVKELCFWEGVVYMVPENYPAVKIGELGSKYLKKICGGYDVTYELLNHTDTISIAGDTLQTLGPLDRDHDRLAQGSGRSVRYLDVVCKVVSPAGVKSNITRRLQLNLMDVNDNPPKQQFSERVMEVSAKNEQELNASLIEINHIIFVDWDSLDVNNYTVELLGDDLHLFDFSHKLWDAEINKDQRETTIHFKISARHGAKIPEEGYEVFLVVNDTAMDPEFGDSTANLTIRFVPPKSLKPAEATAENQRRNILYPPAVNILRTAAMLARVSQPLNNINVSQCRFQLLQHKETFNVTVKGGIIYVRNVIELRKISSPVQLEVKWRNKTSGDFFSDSLTIYLDDEINSTCPNYYTNEVQKWGHCSSQRSKSSCEKTCGLGSGSRQEYKLNHHSRCKWIGDKSGGSANMSIWYSTCTPDRVTCPDNRCDELEELHHWLCPQDCTRQFNPFHMLNKNTSRGIYKGIGICHCDKLERCYCNPPAVKSTTTTTSTTTDNSEQPQFPAASSNTVNVSRRTGDTILAASSSPFPSCGASCILAVAGGGLFLLAAGSVLIACWRRRRVQDAARRDRKLAAAAVAQHTYTPDNPQTPSDVGVGSGQLLLSFDMGAGSVYAAPKIIPVVDSKWEFPRERLRIEQTLGEGEFGRVLRAKALEISNMPGYTTVAVKTLKEGAREAELADLMSEYQLLKEVSHPNVIRLLGACTLPGGPVYLIIEFAEFGSLRNYLRRSRHLEAEGRTPNSTALMLGESEPDSLPTCKITPRDILSFAWQISKGMNYLNDMKLVHRDLAARNVLLASDMVCKISDFGLTRDVYEDDTYLKRTKGRVPVKWMAPESLADHIYNSKSDVWSFGILLWELVTLGASPYPGVAVQNLFHLLRSGYRMEKPENCSSILYKIMQLCWSEDPNVRPSFRSLMMKFETMLADGVDYLDLNPRTVHNRTYFTSLSEALVTPDEIEEPTGYGNLTLMQPETVNLLTQPQNETKCAEVDKLQVLWKRPDSPKASNTRSYENEEKVTLPPQELHHYESPIKCRNKTDGLRTPTNERPQSYIDMAGNNSEIQTLLRSKSKDENETVSKVTSL